MNHSKKESAGILAPPPVIYLVTIGAGYGLECLLPSGSWRHEAARWLGIGLVISGLLLLACCVGQFAAAKTSIDPYKPTSRLITSGLYRCSRNPVYLADFVIQAGVGLWLNSIWILLMMIPTAGIMVFGVVLREEKYLESKFGEEYLLYRQRVRRWI